jgi:hypothetical protein
MSLARYYGTYSDSRGSDVIDFLNDGETLRVTIRGVEFAGNDFDGLSPVGRDAVLEGFTLSHFAELCACSFAFEIPIPVISEGGEVLAKLHVDLELGAPRSNGGISKLLLKSTLEYGRHRVVSSGRSGGFFDQELTEIQRQMPQSAFIKSCINCLFSGYAPGGHPLFGGMMCFRNIKDEYLQVKSKQDFFALSQPRERLVQETYLCPEFSTRTSAAGDRE